MLEEYGITEMVEGMDFFVEEPTVREMSSPWGNTTSLEFFFREKEGKLLGYMKVNIEKSDRGMTAYIIDTTSASGFEHLPPDLKILYETHGYEREKSVKGFGKIEFSYILAYIKENYPAVKVVPVAAYKENEPTVWGLIERVQKSTEGLIERISGGSEMHMATIFLQ